MITPPFLKKGDAVSIVAPSGRLKENALADAIRILQDWGLTVTLGNYVYGKSHSYLAATDDERLIDFQEAIEDSNVKAIFCARGGYGITRILDQIDFSALLRNPKWIVGFSDITSLHLRLNNLSCESIHGIMPSLFTKPNAETSVDGLKRILFGDDVNFPVAQNEFNKLGVAGGQLIGGNLSLVVDSIGTKSEPETKGKILLLEEIDEYKYKIDRMMIHLKRAGKLDELAGLIIGHMTNVLDTENPFGESVEEIILNKVTGSDFPVVFGFPSGHDFPNLAWRSGAHVELNVSNERVSLTYPKSV